jgi:hypothetical protein
MRGETGPGAAVRVVLDGSRFRLVSGGEILGDWDRREIGIHAQSDGFVVRAAGEEFVLKTADDAGLAESLGMAAATPRLARKVAASHPPEDRLPLSEPEPEESSLGPIVFALGGALVLVGGFVLRVTSEAGTPSPPDESGSTWLVFLVFGALMVAVAYALAIGLRWARLGAILIVIGLVVLFVIAARGIRIDSRQFLAYGFIGGGMVLGVAMAFSGKMTG